MVESPTETPADSERFGVVWGLRGLSGSGLAVGGLALRALGSEG